MTEQRQNMPSMGGGEIDSDLYGRVDLAFFLTSLKKCRDMIVLPTGGVDTRPGTRFILEVKDSTVKSIIQPFIKGATDSSMLEFSNLTMRVFKTGGVVETSPGVPFELTTPWATADLPDLRFTQSADILYVAHPDFQTRKLLRFADDNWSVVDQDFFGGPFLPQNVDEALTIQASASEGTITLTAVGFTFDQLHVGSLWKLLESDGSSEPDWLGGFEGTTAITYDQNDRVRASGRVYISTTVNGTEAGVNPPVHTFGSRESGPGKVKWTFLHAGFGIVKITSVAGGGATATATVESTIPQNVVDFATFRFAEGAFSDFRGFPSLIGFFEQRFVAASTPFQDQGLFLSVVDDFDNMTAGGSDADLALQYIIAASNNQVNKLLWMVSGQRLRLGSAGDEFSLGGTNLGEPLTPTSIKVNELTTEGSAAIPGIKVNNAAIYITADGKDVMEMVASSVDFSAGAEDSNPLTLKASSITGPGIVATAWMRHEWRCLWCVRSDGLLAGLTYIRAQQVYAWHLHNLAGGIVEDVAVKPDDAGGQETWFVVKREVDGNTVRYIERLEPPAEKGVDDATNDWYLDSGLQFNGVPSTNISGLDHLEGERVSILADGIVVKDQVVSSGAITLTVPASVVTVGLSQRRFIQTLNPEFLLDGGATAGDKRRVKRLVIRVVDTVGATASVDPPDPEEEEFPPEQLLPSAGQVMSSASSKFDGTLELDLDSGWGNDETIIVEQTQPVRLKILSFLARYDVANDASGG